MSRWVGLCVYVYVIRSEVKFIKRLSNSEAELKKHVAFKKTCREVDLFDGTQNLLYTTINFLLKRATASNILMK